MVCDACDGLLRLVKTCGGLLELLTVCNGPACYGA